MTEDTRKPNLLLPEDDWQTVKETLETLGETEREPRMLMVNIAQTCGVDFIQRVLEKTIDVETQGGLMTKRGDRRRTLGGVFFYLARGEMTRERRNLIFPHRNIQQRRKEWRDALQWDKRFCVLERIQQRGEIHDMQVILIGFPGDIRKQGSTVVIQMTYDAGVVTLPARMPPLPELTTVYTVYIAQKQWEKVAGALKNRGKWLVVEGFLSPDPETDTLAVFASKVSTRTAKPLAEINQPRKGMATASPVQSDNAQPQNRSGPPTLLEPIALIIPDNAPPDVQAKLQDLYAAAQQYHAKINDIQSRPADQQFGLTITLKLLTGIEGQITALVQEYSD